VRRDQFEHVVRAAADIVQDDIVVVGSQAILGQYPDAPKSLLQSLEVDLYPRTDPENADRIDGAIGDGSRFHETYAYYAHGVGPETVVAPAGWEERLVRVEIAAVGRKAHTVVAWCLEIHDLLLAKLAAGRPHDVEFVVEAIRSLDLDVESLERGAELMPKSHLEPTRERLRGALGRASR
jgi:hypothetical protein